MNTFAKINAIRFSSVAAWMALRFLINWIRGDWHCTCSLRIQDRFWIDNQLEVFIGNRFVRSPQFWHNNKLVISLEQRSWRWLQTWFRQWEVDVWFNESNNQPLAEFIACFKDNGFWQWGVDQILLRFPLIRLFWSNNQLKDGLHFVWVCWRLHLHCGFRCCFCWLREIPTGNKGNIIVLLVPPFGKHCIFVWWSNGTFTVRVHILELEVKPSNVEIRARADMKLILMRANWIECDA